MNSLWKDSEAGECTNDLDLRVYTSRLLGREKSLVLHGGGNTSVKISEKNIFGERETILYVKGSGWDLETIKVEGFSPVRLDHVIKLGGLTELSDPQMVNELTTHLLRAGAPAPSVETILHGCLPYRFVDHTHADAVLAASNTSDGERRIREIYGNRCVVIPYLMPGFDLAKYCAEAFSRDRSPATIGMVLLNHGIFSFGDTARESYERMIELVSLAEDYLRKHKALISYDNFNMPVAVDPMEQAELRKRISDIAGFPMVMNTISTTRTTAYSRHENCLRFANCGPITPDHIIRTKRVPMIGDDVDSYARDYRTYFTVNEPLSRERKSVLDCAPRVVLNPAFGMATLGRSAREAMVVAELYEHSMDVILGAEALGGYRPLGERELFEVEYWDLEQAKLRKGGKAPVFAGEVCLVTGAASGIGKAVVTSMLSRGAAVVALDANPAVEAVHSRPDYLGITCDLTDAGQLCQSLEQAVLRFGGIDMAVLNAGIFGESRLIAPSGAGLCPSIWMPISI